MVETNWIDEYAEQRSFVKLPAVDFKLGSEQTEIIKNLQFVDEGVQVQTEYGPKIAFTVLENTERKTFWVGKKWYSVLSVLVDLIKNKKLIGSTVAVTRSGFGAKNTRRIAKLVQAGEPLTKFQ